MMMAKWWLLPTLSDTPESNAGLIKCATSAILQAVNCTHLASLYPSPGSIRDLPALAASPMVEAMDIVLIFVSLSLLSNGQL